MLLRRKSHADRRERQIVLLVRAKVQLVADELPLRIHHGNVMSVDAILQRIGLTVSSATRLRIKKLVMPDQRLTVGRHPSIGLDGVDAVIQAHFKRGQGILRAQPTPAAVSLRVKAIQIRELRRIAGRLLARFFQHGRQKIWAVGDDSIHMQIEQRAHGLHVVNRPRNHCKTGGLHSLDVDGRLRPQQSFVGRRKRRNKPVSMLFGVGCGLFHQSKKRVFCHMRLTRLESQRTQSIQKSNYAEKRYCATSDKCRPPETRAR